MRIFSPSWPVLRPSPGWAVSWLRSKSLTFSQIVPPTTGRVPCEKESQNPPSQLLQALGPPQSQVGGRGKVAQQRMVGNPGGLSKGSGSLCHRLWLWSGSWIRLGLSYLVCEVGAPCKALPMRQRDAQYMSKIATHRAHPLPTKSWVLNEHMEFWSIETSLSFSWSVCSVQ